MNKERMFKKLLLNEEGIYLLNNKVNLKIFGWILNNLIKKNNKLDN
jgi:hypothetical protein